MSPSTGSRHRRTGQRRVPALPGRWSGFYWVAGAVITIACAGLAVASPALGTGAILLALTSALVVMCFSHPNIAFVAIVTLGCSMGTVRRLLDWVQPYGVITQVAPVLPTILLVILAIRLLRSDAGRQSKWKTPGSFIALVVAFILAGVTPLGSGLIANLLASGVLIVAMIMFVIAAKGLISPSAVVAAITIAGVVNALYMIRQDLFGLTPWDSLWVDTKGYAAIYLANGVVRPLGLGASAAESAALCALLVGLSAAKLRSARSAWWLVPLVLGMWAVLVSGTRTFAILALLGLALSFTLGRRRPIRSLIVVLGVFIPFVVVLSTVIHASGSSSLGISRVLMTLSGQEDAATSTAPIHQDLILRSLANGLMSVVGTGSGRISVLAGDGLGSSEQDISNLALVAGVVGVAAGLWFYWDVFRRLPRALSSGWPVGVFAVVALSVFGQWLNIGYYGVTPLIWASLGIYFSTIERSGGSFVGMAHRRKGRSGRRPRRTEPLRSGAVHGDEAG